MISIPYIYSTHWWSGLLVWQWDFCLTQLFSQYFMISSMWMELIGRVCLYEFCITIVSGFRIPFSDYLFPSPLELKRFLPLWTSTWILVSISSFDHIRYIFLLCGCWIGPRPALSDIINVSSSSLGSGVFFFPSLAHRLFHWIPGYCTRRGTFL